MKLTYKGMEVEIEDLNQSKVRIVSINDPDFPRRSFYFPKADDGCGTPCIDAGRTYEGRLVVEEGRAFLDQGNRKVYLGDVG